MISLGIAIKKNELWYSVVDGSNMESAVLLETGKQSFQIDTHTGRLMMNFHNIFTELITKFHPDTIAYKLSLKINMKQIPYMHFSIGVLNLLCIQNNIAVTERSNQWITAGKRVKIINCTEHFSDMRFRTDEEMQATLIAWFEIGQ